MKADSRVAQRHCFNARGAKYIKHYVAIFLFLLAGCAAAPKRTVDPPSSQMREEFGIVALDVRGTYRVPEVYIPVKGALQGAGQGALTSIEGGAEIGLTGSGYGFMLGTALGIALSPFAAISGAIAAHPKEEVMQAQADLTTALTETELAVLLRQDVRAKGNEAGRRVIVGAALMGEAVAGEKSPANSRLELDLFDLRFVNQGEYSPDMTVLLIVRGSVRRSDGSCLLQRSWLYRSNTQNYFKLAANHAALLRRELEVAANRMAAKIVSDLFVSTQPESVGDFPASMPDAGTAVTIVVPRATQDLEPGCPAHSPIELPTPGSV